MKLVFKNSETLKINNPYHKENNMEIIEKSINYLKSLSAETVSNAGTGHTGSAVGARCFS